MCTKGYCLFLFFKFTTHKISSEMSRYFSRYECMQKWMVCNSLDEEITRTRRDAKRTSGNHGTTIQWGEPVKFKWRNLIKLKPRTRTFASTVDIYCCWQRQLKQNASEKWVNSEGKKMWNMKWSQLKPQNDNGKPERWVGKSEVNRSFSPFCGP